MNQHIDSLATLMLMPESIRPHRLGAIKYINDNSLKPEVHPFDWSEVASGVIVPVYALDAMLLEVQRVIRRSPSRPRLDLQKTGHRIYMTLAFCHLLRGAKIGEIRRCFTAIAGAPPVTDTLIRQYLDTLQICGMVAKVANGAKNVLYVPKIGRLPIEPAFSDKAQNSQRNILRWINVIREEIQAEDPVRLEIFQEHNHGA